MPSSTPASKIRGRLALDMTEPASRRADPATAARVPVAGLSTMTMPVTATQKLSTTLGRVERRGILGAHGRVADGLGEDVMAFSFLKCAVRAWSRAQVASFPRCSLLRGSA